MLARARLATIEADRGRGIFVSDNVYAWAGFVLIVSTSWLISLPRYLVALYPIFFIGARATRSRPTLVAVLTVFIAIQVWFFWWYAAGTWTF